MTDSPDSITAPEHGSACARTVRTDSIRLLLKELADRTGIACQFDATTGSRVSGVPVESNGTVIGSLSWDCSHPPPPPPAETPDALTGDSARVLAGLAVLIGGFAGLQDTMQLRLAELNAVYHVSSQLNISDDVTILLSSALETVSEVMGVDAAAIRLMDVQTNELVVKAWINLRDSYFDKGPVLAGDSEFDTRALSGEVVYVEDLQTDPRVRYPDLVKAEGLRSLLNMGLLSRGKPVGVMRLYTRRVRHFSDFDLRLLKAAAQLVATAIENRTLLDQRRAARTFQRQLSLASSVQRRLLPQEMPVVPGLDIAARCLPSLELSGDFFRLH
ncbi:MAG: GAF domain-containing protein [Planctomycetes bacterium]|nr:GAF domain-containing protein [Planctomycetota bacterium]